MMKRMFVLTAAIALLCLGGIAQADVSNLGPGLTNLETVRVGDAGNAADTRYGSSDGSVGYDYKIGRYEVTAAQYCDFLNAVAKTDAYGLYNTSMWSSGVGCKILRIGTSGSYSYTVASDRANRPVNWVSYWDSCRFANWLGNGQGAGSTETGAYTLNGYNGDDGRTIQRNAGWKWAVTSEDEWYKAAYYKGGGTNAGYWEYPTQSETVPSNLLVYPDPGNSATIYNNGFTIGSPYYQTEAGAHENSFAAYGTFDQAGNVWEWNEVTLADGARGWRGGSYIDDGLQASAGYYGYLYGDPTYEVYGVGFRVSEVVPDPVIPIVIDIRPGSDQNNINLRSRGVLTVAILTTDEFDTSGVDPATCRFCDAAPVQWAMKDANHDRYKDLILQFRTEQLNLSPDAATAILTGDTWDGHAVEGTDNVRVIPPAR